MTPASIDKQTPEILVEITLFETGRGGRQSPLCPPHFTCPLLLDEELFTCRIYLASPVHPGETFRAKMRLLAPELLADRLMADVSFELWEGHPIASGKVLVTGEVRD